MKKYLFVFLAFIMFASFFSSCSKKSDWIAKIDGHVIPLSEFNMRYEMYMQQLRMQPNYKPLTPDEEKSLKEELLKNMIGEYLIYKQLKKEKFDKSKEMQELFKQFLIQKYLEQKFAADLNVTQAEIDKFYNENKKYFKNMDPDIAMQRIQYQLTLKKFETKTAEIIDRLYGKAKIEKNETVLLPVNIPTFSTNNEKK